MSHIGLLTKPDSIRIIEGSQRDGDGNTRNFELVLRRQLISNVNADIYSVMDPLAIHGETHIAPNRQRRNIGTVHTAARRQHARLSPAECDLCKAAPEKSRDLGAFAINNTSPFGPNLHQLVVTRRHIESLGDIRLEDLQAIWTVLHRIAADESLQAGLLVGMNFGESILSGASQPHLHYQITGLSAENHNVADRLGQKCREYTQLSCDADYLADYLQALERANLVIERNDFAVLYVPIAQRVRYELQFMLLDPSVGNLRDASPAQCNAMSELEYKAIRLYHRLGIQAFNEMWYMTRFGLTTLTKQRLIVSLCPRTVTLGFFELSQHFVVDQFPWNVIDEIQNFQP